MQKHQSTKLMSVAAMTIDAPTVRPRTAPDERPVFTADELSDAPLTAGDDGDEETMAFWANSGVLVGVPIAGPEATGVVVQVTISLPSTSEAERMFGRDGAASEKEHNSRWIPIAKSKTDFMVIEI